MSADLLLVVEVDDLLAYLGDVGMVFRVFDQQGSGCVSYGVASAGRRWFVKTAAQPPAVASLERASAVHQAIRHPVIVPLWRRFVAAGQPVLVYPWIDGEVLYPPTRTSRGGRTDPASAMTRFRELPVAEVEKALDEVLAAHVAVEAAGFVASDLYDGCLLYDFGRWRMRLVDLDEYRPGPYVLREPPSGSLRFMAPEERIDGTVDVRTTVFNLGRLLRLLLDAGDVEQQWRGSDEQRAVVDHATRPRPDLRHRSVAELIRDWRVVTGPRSATAAPGGRLDP